MPVVRAAAAAFAFLTRIPVPLPLEAADVARGAVLFPVVGAGIGAAVGGSADALAGPLTPTLAAVLAVALGAVLTGALHLDGLADTADALGATTRERALEIMRDHRIGAYGGVALVLDLGVKVAAVAALATHRDALVDVACAVAVARAVPVLVASTLPYARSEGTGGVLGGTGRSGAAFAALLAAALCVGLGRLELALVVPAAALVCALVSRKWLGGVTGDTLGATAELTELAALVLAVALL